MLYLNQTATLSILVSLKKDFFLISSPTVSGQFGLRLSVTQLPACVAGEIVWGQLYQSSLGLFQSVFRT